MSTKKKAQKKEDEKKEHLDDKNRHEQVQDKYNSEDANNYNFTGMVKVTEGQEKKEKEIKEKKIGEDKEERKKKKGKKGKEQNTKKGQKFNDLDEKNNYNLKKIKNYKNTNKPSSNNKNMNNSLDNNNSDLSILFCNNRRINNNQNNNIVSKNISNSIISSGKELFEIMNNLFSEDESEKMDTIIIIHEILCYNYQQNKYILIPNIDNIIKIIIQITHELFLCIENLKKEIIPLKFVKYLVMILCKLTTNKEMIRHLTYKVLYDLCYELLNYLLINGLDKIGSNQEGNIIFKSLNSAMLRVIENCDTTSVILALLEIIKQSPNNINLSNLATKCLIKISLNIKTIINNIQLDKIFLQMHLLIYNFNKFSTNNLEQSSQSNIMIIRFIKNFIIDVVKIKKEYIMEDYIKSVRNSGYKDNYMFKWIKGTLDSLGGSLPDIENKDANENNNSIENNETVKVFNKNRSRSTNIKRINNVNKKRENRQLNFEGNKKLSNIVNYVVLAKRIFKILSK